MDKELTKSSKSRVSIMAIKSQKSTSKSAGNLTKKSGSRLKARRSSYGFGGVPGIRTVEGRTSQVGLEFKRPPLLYLNTYQLDPHIRFNATLVTKSVNQVLDERFTNHKYNVQESPGLTLRVAAEVMRNVKEMGFDRYRIITVVTIGQRRAQCYNNAVAFLWDHERDDIVHEVREVNTAFIQVTVFGVYLD